MKVIYAILATAGWVWLAVVFVYMWLRTRPPRPGRRGFEVVPSEATCDRPGEHPSEPRHEHEEQR